MKKILQNTKIFYKFSTQQYLNTCRTINTNRILNMQKENEFPVIELPQGKVKGCKRQTIYDKFFYSFEGIPFGKPPVGDLRFKAPQPAEPWDGIRECIGREIKALQRGHGIGEIKGSEDCLYLNVYAKELKSKHPLPVMVFIYGGGFVTGGAVLSEKGPDYFMEKNVVLVMLNYRVDCLGFLSLKDPDLQVPGNAGLKDQVLGLKWVKEYICHFNGDANNITVFGESAGAVSTHFMVATQQTCGLFHKAILQSGSILNDWRHTSKPDIVYQLAKYHGYDGENCEKDILEFLQKIDGAKLLNYQFPTEMTSSLNLYHFGPIVEPYVGSDCVVPKEPVEMLKNSWGNNIPMLIGGNSFEGLIMYPILKENLQLVKAIQEDPKCFLPKEVQNSHSEEELTEMGKLLVETYFNESLTDDELKCNFLHFCSHQMFWHAIHRAILSRVNYATSPTYQYRFDFDSPDFNLYRIRFCGDDITEGVAHADDLVYLFLLADAYKLGEDTAEFRTIQRMINIWTTFAETSNPNCKETNIELWPPVDKTNPNVAVNISCDIDVIDIPEKCFMEIWNSLYKNIDLY